MAPLAEMQRFAPRRFRWEDVGFALDNLEEGMEEESAE
jgi:hypothetical protein